MVSLLVALEAAYGISFPEDEITFATFADPEWSWTTVDRLRRNTVVEGRGAGQ
jgi:hypothetical protein